MQLFLTLFLGGNLGHNVLASRLESLNYERRTLATTFYFMARAGYLTPAVFLQALDWLQRNPLHDLTSFILSAVLASRTHTPQKRMVLCPFRHAACLFSFHARSVPAACLFLVWKSRRSSNRRHTSRTSGSLAAFS